MIALLFVIGMLAGGAHVVADATAPPPPGDDAATVALATVLVAQAQSGAIDRTLFNARMNAALTPTVLASVGGQLAPLGKPLSVAFVARDSRRGLPAYHYRVVWPSRSVDESFALDRDGKIAGWLFLPTDASSATPTTPPAVTPSASPSRGR